MARQTLPWTELKTGLLVLTALIILAVAIMSVGQKGRIFADTYTLTTKFPAVLGLKQAAPVWLAGVDVGSVSGISFVMEEGNPKPVVHVRLTIGREFQELIRSDSVASIDGKGLLGDKIIAISVGSASAAVLPDGGFLPSTPPADFTQLVAQAGDAVQNLNAITADLRVVSGDLQEGRGSLGKFFKDQTLYDNLEQTTGNLAAFTAKLGKTDGSLIKLLNDPKLYDEVTALVTDLRKGDGTLAKLINDPNLYDEARGTLERARAIVQRVDSVIAKTEAGEGNMGKLMSDEELYKNLNGTIVELKELIADIKKNPSKYVKVSVF
jgi:phospholipid/cholesterol/gamma-HCH transport system substrate-binding protein